MIVMYPVEPVAAPRQTRGDAWNPSDAVQRYRAYRDELQILHAVCPTEFHHAVFLIKMPISWAQSKVDAQRLQPHRSKPDRDNLEKAFLDSIFADDSAIWNGQTTKLWWDFGAIVICDRPLDLRCLVEQPVRDMLRNSYLDSVNGGKRALHVIDPLGSWLEGNLAPVI